MSNRNLVNLLQAMTPAVRQSPQRALFLAVAVAICGLMTVADLPSPAPVQAQEQRETVPPDFKGSPSVDGATLLVSYDEALDEDSVPATDAFVLKVVLRGGSMYWQDESAGRAVDRVSVTGSAVVLTLAKAVTAEEYVVLSYTPPSDATAPRTRDVAGNAAPGFGPVQVSNNTEEAPEDKNPAPNTPATGEPTISGTDQVGETLTADVSGIADEDGLANAEFSYQWLREDDADIAGAAGSTYTLVDADEGRTIRVRVSFTDDAGNEKTLTSAAIGPVEPRPERAISEVPPEAVPELPPGGVFAGFTLVNLDDKSEVHVLADGATVKLDDPAGGSYAILADTQDDVRNLATIAIGSVELVLTGAKEVTTVDRYVAYSLYGGGAATGSRPRPTRD